MLHVKALILFASLQTIYTAEENHVLTVCPDGVTQCHISSFCCELGNGRYGCCPLTDGNCCSDGVHCCPNGYKCETGVCVLGTKTIPAIKITKSRNRDPDNTVCPDGSSCPGEETCCVLASGKYGCCLYPDATCCPDKLHCCPSGYTCSEGYCTPRSNKIPAYKHTKMISKIPDNTVCLDGSTCAAKRSCCPLATGQYGCCPYSYATCCSDKVHCCPDGYTCKRDSCTKGSSTIVFKKLTMSVEKGTKLQTGSDDKVVINQKLQ